MYRKQTYNNNKTKAYAFLWEQCVEGMQSKTESWKDYASKIRNDPIELLIAIKQHTPNYQENWYKMAIIFHVLTTLVSLRQKEEENPQDYTKRFKISRDLLKTHIGWPVKLTNILKGWKDMMQVIHMR